ncbi:cyclin-D5-2-like [Canna indica]|uniref:Cyclin-D5-2-like n=1 Tax=Canna indica TaxID=4628 RepID=A0AAQ3QIN8_9LILI|nr:cyclin-D5-2-like [Canna indica]
MADSSSMVSPSTVICTEDGEENAKRVLCEDSLVAGTDEEYIELLMSRESCFCSRTLDPSSANSVESARPEAVRWILKMKSLFGFSIRTAYLAVSYFDHFFLHRAIDLTKVKSWAIELLSVACLSLAAKMEEWKVTSLSEFQTKDYSFNTGAIQRMELLVLSTLEWRMSRVTPFSYLNYFASKFQEHGSEGLLLKAIELIFASIKVMNLVDYRASVMAAAAILAASDERLTQKSVKSKMSVISSCRSMDIDDVFSCYTLMIQETKKENFKTSMVNCSSINHSSEANGAISYLIASSKRRRLQ